MLGLGLGLALGLRLGLRLGLEPSSPIVRFFHRERWLQTQESSNDCIRDTAERAQQ